VEESVVAPENVQMRASHLNEVVWRHKQKEGRGQREAEAWFFELARTM
jgi:hypothetical protein